MPLGFPPAAPDDVDPGFEPIAYSDLPGWDTDDHAAAWAAFRRSCAPILKNAETLGAAAKTAPPAALLAVCRLALSGLPRTLPVSGARAFFETHFAPHRVTHTGPAGLLTAYYEPVLDGARAPDARFGVPIYRRPPDLVNMVTEAERGNVASRFTHMKKTDAGLVPYDSRAEIEQGALAGRGLEFLWLAGEVDTFFMHIQGSGRIRLPDGTMVRITYDGKNGHPYTSVGRYLIDAGHFTAEEMSLDTMKQWLSAGAVRGRTAMWQNKSFVFFRELVGEEASDPMGVLEIPLSEGRSLAVDTAFHCIGTPVYVTAPTLSHIMGDGGFRRLMIAQDVGSAIRGPERGDLYMGSGDRAGKIAGITKHPGRFTVLLPRDRP